jgi:hypothetical protein
VDVGVDVGVGSLNWLKITKNKKKNYVISI